MERLSDAAISIVDDLHTECLNYYTGYIPLINALDKLADFEDAEENGTLIKLPCKVGDERYFISYDGFIETGIINTIQIVMTQDFYDEVFYISGVSREKWIGRDGMYRTCEESGMDIEYYNSPLLNQCSILEYLQEDVESE